MNGRTISSRETDGLTAALSIVHDLRNPLAAIHGSAEILVRSRLSRPQVHRIAQNLYSASVRMRELLEEFLDRNRGEQMAVAACDIRDLVASAVDKIALNAELQSVDVIQLVPSGLVVAINGQRMTRVLVNVLVNALEAMPTGGTIRVTAVFDRGTVTIRIRDTGPGIAPEIRSRLFQPFATAGKAGGIGLGLAYSRQAVLDQGGDMSVSSSRRGACFAIRLPRTMQPAAAALC